MTQSIASKSRVYAVGQRHLYVYHLLGGGTITDDRAKALIAKYELTPEEIAGLDADLQELAGRRAAKSAKTDKPVDPYWSLWGKLKAQHEGELGIREDTDELYEHGGSAQSHVADAMWDDYRESRKVLRLPCRGVEVRYDGECLIINGKQKQIKNDTHAVNSLRKLDTDDGYFDEAMNG